MAARRAVERIGLPGQALDGEVAVVTGAGSGIGREVAFALAYLGARVIIAELDGAAGREAAAEIAAAGGAARFVGTDMGDEAAVTALVEGCRAPWGPVSILINNAIVCPVAPIAETSPAAWDRVMAVNLRGPFLMVKAFLPGMVQRDHGTIVNLISTEAVPRLAAYISSKQGLAGLTGCIAAEVGECGVYAVALAPGLVDTAGLRRAVADLAPALGQTAEEFVRPRLHEAYEGLMPADHAGAAVAYLVARLAKEYHGKQVDGYQVLERAGIIAGGGEPGRGLVPPHPAEEPPAEPAVLVFDAAGALALARQLGGALAETETELGRLPVFVRPLARRGFRDLAGLTIQGWSALLEGLVGLLELVAAGREVPGEPLAESVEATLGLLPKLAAYYRQVPQQTARFTRDAAVCGQVQDATAARLQIIDRLAAALRAWAVPL